MLDSGLGGAKGKRVSAAITMARMSPVITTFMFDMVSFSFARAVRLLRRSRSSGELDPVNSISIPSCSPTKYAFGLLEYE